MTKMSNDAGPSRRLKTRPATYDEPICPSCRVLLENEEDGRGRIVRTYCAQCGRVAVVRLSG